MKISIVIPNFNGEKLLDENLPQIFGNAEAAEVIVVDDGSSDKSLKILEALSRDYKNLVILKNTENLGFSSAVNKGVKHASGDIIILFNTDVVPEKGFIKKVLPYFSDDKVFAIGFMDKSVEGGKIVERGRGIGIWKKGFLLHARGEVDKTDTLWASGGSSAFRKSLWDKLGGLQELYNPFYWEDIDLSYRALKAGYKIYFCPEIVVKHEHERGTIKTLFTTQKVTATAFRNQLYFVWLNISDPLYLLQHILYLPYHILKALMRGNMNFVSGFIAAFRHIIPVMRQRMYSQKMFTVSDKDLLQRFRS